jgi:hypothetical protein
MAIPAFTRTDRKINPLIIRDEFLLPYRTETSYTSRSAYLAGHQDLSSARTKKTLLELLSKISQGTPQDLRLHFQEPREWVSSPEYQCILKTVGAQPGESKKDAASSLSLHSDLSAVEGKRTL